MPHEQGKRAGETTETNPEKAVPIQ